MKKPYSHPIVANSEVTDNFGLVPLGAIAAAVATAAGYAVARSITNAVKASPYSKTPSLTRRSSN